MPSKFRLEIQTLNAAFAEEGAEAEIARCLRKVAEGLEDGFHYGSIFDINGNRIGSFEVVA